MEEIDPQRSQVAESRQRTVGGRQWESIQFVFNCPLPTAYRLLLPIGDLCGSILFIQLRTVSSISSSFRASACFFCSSRTRR
jgi:hypothetical protein